MLETETRQHTSRPLSAEPIGVCHIASGDCWAGAEVQVATLLRSLSAKNEFRMSAIFLNEGRLGEEARKCGVEVTVIPEHSNGFFEILSKAAQFFHGKSVQILHSHRYKESLLSAFLAHRCRIPHVIRTQHGLLEPRPGYKGLKQALIHAVDRCALNWTADRVIGVSSDVTNRLRKHVRAGKVVTIFNGVDRDVVRSSLNVAEAKRRLGIPVDCMAIGTAGRLERVKRLDIFLGAAKLIATQHSKTRFVIAGDGSERLRLQAFAHKLGIAHLVHFLGHRNDVFDVLRAFDILVICSDHEGLPMVLLEALLLGVAVVSRRVGGISEVIEDNRTGVLVASDSPSALAEACLGVLADEAHRRELGIAGRARTLEKFSAEQTGLQIAQLYRSLVAST